MMRLLGTLAVLGLFSSRNCCDPHRCDSHRCDSHRCGPQHCQPHRGGYHGGYRDNWNNHNRRW